MKSHNPLFSPRTIPFILFLLGAVASPPISARGATAAGSKPALGRTFASPEDAVRALSIAANNHDTSALAAIFGPGYEDIESPDPVEAANELATFAASLNASNHLARLDNSRYILETGSDRWPFPIPLVRIGQGWFFDTLEGKQELLNRRIGRDELQALRSIRAGAEAQREYASADRNGDGVRQFAQRIISTPGRTDGLYWPAGPEGPISPLGPAFARAQSQGYFKRMPNQDAPQPFRGYYFKILTQQGKHAPGGKYSYIINGNMIGGFAFVGWPAEYGESGIMTFIINQQGRVYQKDLGPNTATIASKMKTYEPDPSWTLSPD
jgi:hypothetical protein